MPTFQELTKVRGQYPVTFLSGGVQDCSDLHRYGPGIRDIYILQYVLSGRGTYQAGDHTFALSPGQTFLIYPGEVVSYFPDEREPWVYIWVDIGGSEARGLLRQTGFTRACPVAPALPREEVEPLYRRVHTAGDGRCEYHRVQANGYLQLLLAYYMDRFPCAQPEDDGYRYVQSALQYIAASYHRPLTVEDIASFVGLSRTHLYRLFHRHLSISPNEYLTRFRIQTACSLLRSSTLPVKYIAYSVGFEDPLYFTKVFRRILGEPPTAYRLAQRP